MPKLLKKISRKNLRSSRSSDGSESTEQDTPPLPTGKYNNYEDGSYLSFSPNPSHYDSAKSSPNGSPRPRMVDLDRSHSDFGHYQSPPNNFGQDQQGRKPSLNGYVENLPSRHPSHTGSEYSRARTTSHTSPVRPTGYYDPTPSPSYPRPRTTSQTSSPGPRRGSAPDTSSPVSPQSAGSGRPGFVTSPSQLAYSHVDLSYYEEESQPSSRGLPPSAQSTAPPPQNYAQNTPSSRGFPPSAPNPAPAPQTYAQNTPPAQMNSVQPNAPPEDEFSKNLAGAWDIATTAPKVSKTDKVLQVIGPPFFFPQICGV
jgi:hypothetical protein